MNFAFHHFRFFACRAVFFNRGSANGCHGFHRNRPNLPGTKFSTTVLCVCSQLFIPLLAALDLGAGDEQLFHCLVVQQRQAVQSMRRSMDWTVEDNMVDGFSFCATLTVRRGGDTPFCTSRSGNSRHQCGGGWVGARRLTLMGYFPVLLSDKLMSCCAADTNGCLDLRRLAFALDGQGGCWVEQVSKLHGTAS